MLGEVAAPVDLSYISDTSVVLRFFEAEGRVRRAIAVQKRRVGPHEHSIRELRITGRGIEIGEPLRAFEGILSGRPRYLGSRGELIHREDE
jgi:circadian clock protein KaiC